MKTIAVDLDGTLAYYDGWKGGEHIGPPIPEMLFKVRMALAQGDTVVIFTARASRPEDIPPVKEWLKSIGLPDLKVTNEKTYDISEVWDDRARQVIPNEGRFVGETKSIDRR